MFWVLNFAKRGGSLKGAIKEFTKMNGRMPSSAEMNKMEAIIKNTQSNVIPFPKRKSSLAPKTTPKDPIDQRWASQEEWAAKRRAENKAALKRFEEKFGKPEDRAFGGRVGFKVGGILDLLNLIRGQFGKKAITTADKIKRPDRALLREMFEDFNKKYMGKKSADEVTTVDGDIAKKSDRNRAPTADEVEDYMEDLPHGGELNWWEFGKTVDELDKAVAGHKAYVTNMYQRYKRGDLEKYVKPEVREASRLSYQKKIDKVLDKAYDEVFYQKPSSGDYKYDADVLSDSIAEQLGKVYDDLPVMQQSQIYDTALKRVTQDMQMKRTLKNIEQQMKLSDFDVTGRKKNAYGGLAGQLHLNQGGRVRFDSGGSWSRLKKKYKGSTLQAILDNPQLMAAELGHDGIFNLLQLLGMKEGGRVRFDKGGMSRRKFLQLMGGLAALPIVGKFFKFAKPAATAMKAVEKSNAAGMPTWFPSLVNKVMKEGKDVSKQYATTERVIVKEAQLPGSKTKILVEQDLTTGNTTVDIGLGKHGWDDGRHGQPVRLHLQKGEWIEPKKGQKKGVKTKDEFDVEEAEFTGSDPTDIKFDESVVEKYGDHASDFTEVEKYATGKNVDKFNVKGTKKREADEWAQGQAEADAERWADEADDFAKGGLAGVLRL